MFERRSLAGPITLGVLMIVLVVLLIAGWVSVTLLLSTKPGMPNWIYWALSAAGSILLICILLGVIAYLTLSVKAINLNRRQSNFIDSVTHELKSPITSLKLYLQTLTMRTVDEEQRAHFQRFMLDDVQRLDQLINHLLEVGRVERGALPREDESLRIDELLQLAAETVCLRYQVPFETVVLEVPPLRVSTKPAQVDILFRNLIDNAVKYGGSPPEVRVIGERQGKDHLIVRVVDNGPGIPPKLRRKVFGRFVRLGSELERSQPGTGLGLYLVRNMIRGLGGTVRVQDRKDASGTIFEVTLPGEFLEQPAPSDASPPAPQEAGSPPAGAAAAGDQSGPAEPPPRPPPPLPAPHEPPEAHDPPEAPSEGSASFRRLSRLRFAWYEALRRPANASPTEASSDLAPPADDADDASSPSAEPEP